MIASLGMYDRPETRAANDRFWQLIRDDLRRRGVDAPDRLDHDTPPDQAWLADDLVLAQTCGRPFRRYLRGRVNLVGTPDYQLRDCPPGHYRSALVVRAADPRTRLEEFRNACFAYNDQMSQSGWAAAQHHTTRLGFRFTRTLASGGHVRSARAVAEARADIASLDALSWDMIKRYEECSMRLRVLDWTEPTPGLPFITGRGVDAEKVFAAIETAIAALDLVNRRILRIRRLVRIPEAAYQRLPDV